jgi:hypothetical protein
MGRSSSVTVRTAFEWASPRNPSQASPGFYGSKAADAMPLSSSLFSQAPYSQAHSNIAGDAGYSVDRLRPLLNGDSCP